MKTKKTIKTLSLLIFSAIILSSFASANIFSEIDEMSELSDEISEFIDKESIIIIGEHSSKTEKIALGYIKEKNKEVSRTLEIKESEYNSQNYPNNTLVLIGGPNQNKITKEILSNGYETDNRNLSFGIISFITTKDNKKYLIFSDKAGYLNLERNLSSSPLAKFIPVEYIPITATAIGLSLLWFWHFISGFLSRIFRSILSSKIMKFVKKKQLKITFTGFNLLGVRIKIREWISIILAALIFALTVSCSFVSKDAWTLILVTFTVNLVIYAIRNISRLLMDKVHNLHTEYVFWIWGAVVTALSGWLGNTFGLAGYMISEEKSDKEANIQYAINLWSFIASLIFLVLNIFFTSVFFQMAVLLCMSIAVIQMMPFAPFSGKLIFEKSKIKWFILFIPMITIYFYLNLAF